MRIEKDEERRFYEIEAVNQRWTFRQLQRQYGSSLYKRLTLSRNKTEVLRLANKQESTFDTNGQRSNYIKSLTRTKRQNTRRIWTESYAQACRVFNGKVWTWLFISYIEKRPTILSNPYAHNSTGTSLFEFGKQEKKTIELQIPKQHVIPLAHALKQAYNKKSLYLENKEIKPIPTN